MEQTPKILVCVTGQKSCEELIRHGAELAKEQGAELSVVHVSKRGNTFLGGDNDAQALEYLFDISKSYNADMMLLRNDDVAGTIASHAKKLGASVIVVGSRGKGSGNAVLHQLQNHLPNVEIKTVFTKEN